MTVAEAGTYSTARTGNWLWALLVGATLLVMEFILLAALVPAAWSERVRVTELAWLQEGLGANTAQAIVERAEHWYSMLFVVAGAGRDQLPHHLAERCRHPTRRRSLAARRTARVVMAGGTPGRHLGGALSGIAALGRCSWPGGRFSCS